MTKFQMEFEQLLVEIDKLKSCVAIASGENQCKNARENYRHKALTILKIISNYLEEHKA